MKLFFLLLLSAMIIAPRALAVSISITDYPKEVNPETEFNIRFTVTGAKTATNYFRVLVFKENTHTYNGLTWNGNSWYNGADGKQYLPISVVTSGTSGECKAKLESSVEGGAYLLSIKRYTESGASAASDDISPVQINLLAIQTSTPVPQPQTPKPTPSLTTVPTRPPATPIQNKQDKVEEIDESEKQTFVLAQATLEPPRATVQISEATLSQTAPSSAKSSNLNMTSPLPLILGLLSGLAGLGFVGFGVYTLRYVRQP